jgi:hypothetical protein
MTDVKWLVGIGSMNVEWSKNDKKIGGGGAEARNRKNLIIAMGF